MLFSINTVSASTKSRPIPYSTWDILGSLSHIAYKETVGGNLFVKDTGHMLGLEGAWTFRYPSYFMMKVDVTLATGTVDYESAGTGTINSIRDNLFEIRGVLGHDFRFRGRRITPYLGAGYRLLDDEAGGRFSTTGAVGYDRDANYYYSPIGVDARVFEGEFWIVDLIGEYDHFWRGVQRSHEPAATLVNEQRNGYGARGSVRILRKLNKKRKLVIEPYTRHWHIADSETSCSIVGPGLVLCGLEPDNTSMEYGVKFGARF